MLTETALDSVPLRRKCLMCPRTVRGKTARKVYCGETCRKAAWRERQQLDTPAQRSPRREAISAALQLERDALRLQPLREDPYCAALASVREAEEVIRLWMRRLERRRERLAKLPRTALDPRLQVLRQPEERRAALALESCVGLADSTPDLLVIVYGRAASPA